MRVHTVLNSYVDSEQSRDLQTSTLCKTTPTLFLLPLWSPIYYTLLLSISTPPPSTMMKIAAIAALMGSAAAFAPAPTGKVRRNEFFWDENHFQVETDFVRVVRVGG